MANNHFHFRCQLNCDFFFLKIYYSLQGERDNHASACLLPKMAARVGLGIARCGSLELHLGFQCEWQAPIYLDHASLLAQALGEKLDSNLHSNVGCQHCWKQLNSLCHVVSPIGLCLHCHCVTYHGNDIMPCLIFIHSVKQCNL